MQDMFAAAIDTSYTTLEWAMAELMNHPDKMRRLQAEIRAVGRRQRHRGPPRQAVLPQVRDQGDARLPRRSWCRERQWTRSCSATTSPREHVS
jgi:cytochrome P450